MYALADIAPKRAFPSSRPAQYRPSTGSIQEALTRQPLRRLAPHEHLFREGEPERHIHRIERGLLTLYKLLPDGRRQVISFRFPGDILVGDTPGEQYCSAEAATEVTFRSVPLNASHREASEHPRFTSELIELLSQELANTRSQISVLNRRSAIEKLAAFVLDLWRRQAGHAGKGDQVKLELTRNDIADFLGLTIETVSRNLTKLRQQKVINLVDVHTLVILDRGRLEELASGQCKDW